MVMMPATLPEGWEDWLAFFSAQLPRPIEQVEAEDGSLTFTAGDPGEVIVHLTPSVIRVGEFSVEWRGSDEPEVRARWLGRVYWRRIPPPLAIPVVERLIDAAREMRRSRFRTCEVCEKRFPPESMFDDTTCQECAPNP